MTELLRLSDLDRHEWEKLLAGSSSATFFHTAEWGQVWEKSYPFFESRFLVEKSPDGSYRAGLPFVKTKKLLAGYYSMPMGTYGGVLGEVSDFSTGGLYAELLKRTKSAKTERVVITLEREEPALTGLGFELFTRFSHKLELSEGFFPGRSRSMKKDLERARRAGFTHRRLTQPEELSPFRSFRGRGRKKGFYTPNFYGSLIGLLVPTERVFWFGAFMQNRPAAYQICFVFGGEIIFWDADFDPHFSGSAPGHFLTDEILHWAWSRGIKKVSFGQTPSEAKGATLLKERMGGKKTAVYEYTYTSPFKKKLRVAYDKIRSRR